MGIIFAIAAVIIFFMAGVGWSLAPPNPMAWGLFCLALAIAVGGWWPANWRRPGP